MADFLLFIVDVDGRLWLCTPVQKHLVRQGERLDRLGRKEKLERWRHLEALLTTGQEAHEAELLDLLNGADHLSAEAGLVTVGSFRPIAVLQVA